MVRRRKMKSPSSPMAGKAPWERDRWLKRREEWIWRLTPFVKGLIKDKCGTCQLSGRCNRIPLNPKILAEVIRKRECSDYKTVWKQILDEEPYDWGF